MTTLANNTSQVVGDQELKQKMNQQGKRMPLLKFYTNRI